MSMDLHQELRVKPIHDAYPKYDCVSWTVNESSALP